MPMNLDSVGAVSRAGRTLLELHGRAVVLARRRRRAARPDGLRARVHHRELVESEIAQKVLPTLPVIVGMGAGKMPSFGDINWAMLVHGEQSIEVYGPIPTDGDDRVPVARSSASTTRARARSRSLETESTYKDTGKPAFKVRFAAFIRGEGGFGESRGRRAPRAGEDPRARTRPRDHVRDALGPGAALPLVGRPQPAALRSRLRQAGRISEADPARLVHLRIHGAGVAAHVVRIGPGEVHGRWTPASRSPSSRATS